MYKFNPYSAGYLTDPYPALAELRTNAPVYESIGFGSLVYILSSYHDVKATLSDSRFQVEDLPSRLTQKELFLHNENAFQNVKQLIYSWLFFIEGGGHARIRKIFAKVFSPTTMESYRLQVRDLIKELVADKLALGTLDVMNDLAFPLPTLFMSNLLGIPILDRERFLKWASDLFFVFQRPISFNEYKVIDQSAKEFGDYITDYIKVRKNEKTKNDLLGYLLAYEDEEGRLNDDQLVSLCVMLFGVGQETAGNLIGNGMYALLNNPEQMKLLETGAASFEDAVEEMGRYDTPVQFIERITKEAVTIRGKIIPSDSIVYLCLAAANRDPEQYANPHEFNVLRGLKNTLPYGNGRHYCIGAALARIQTQEAIGFLTKLDDVRMVQSKITRRRSMIIRSLLSFPITFNPMVS